MEIKLSDDLLDEMIYVIFDIDYDEENKHRLSVGNKLTKRPKGAKLQVFFSFFFHMRLPGGPIHYQKDSF